MAHCIVAEAEALLDKEFPVLKKGFVRLVDYMGSDERIVQAARVSYGKGTKSFRQDIGLIDFLLRNDHTSPFEQVIFTFHIKLPIFVARQWIRHRTARVNEISGRYSVMQPEFYVPEPEDVAFQSKDNKQGRSSTPVPESQKQEICDMFKKDQELAYTHYQTLIDSSIARELSRINLPLSLFTEWYWQIDLHNLFNFLKLRLHPHAQKEIRDYATILYQIGKTVCPNAFAAFKNHVLDSIKLSSQESEAFRVMLAGKQHQLTEDEIRKLKEKLNSTQCNCLPSDSSGTIGTA